MADRRLTRVFQRSFRSLQLHALFCLPMVIPGLILGTLCEASTNGDRLKDATRTGEMRVWHPVILGFSGPQMDGDANNPNPLLYFRLTVTFFGPTGQAYWVPGYFDGDGNGGGSGRIWRVKFTPDSPGWWTYETNFRSGTGVAVSRDTDEGRRTLSDGARGRFLIQAQSKRAEGFSASLVSPVFKAYPSLEWRQPRLGGRQRQR